ncbi:MAG: septum site-determining protein MinC [Chloroflexia bacterium]
MEELVRLKGDRTGLRLVLAEEAPLETLLAALEEQLRRGESFFRGAELLVDVGNRALSLEELGQLTAILQRWGVDLRAVGTVNRQTRGTLRDAGVRSVPSAGAPQPSRTDTGLRLQAIPEALFITRTVRSGQAVRHHGPVTVVGDVNPGAEVLAGGDVVVWGRLRGVVHAGAIGDERAIVCALDLSPTQLRIANLAARPPEEPGPSTGPEVAYIAGGRIVVEPWDLFRRP